jgi:tight adherence protein B
LVTHLLAAFAGPLVLATITAIVFAIRPPQLPTEPVAVWVPEWARRLRPGLWSGRQQLQVALGVTAAVVAGFGTGWPAAAVLGGLAGTTAPALVGGRARREEGIARIEAVATWTEQLRDVLAAAEGIHGAIVATAPVAPAPIAPEVHRLVDRMTVQGQRLRPALIGFAGDLAHPLGDMVVASLLLAAEHQGSPTRLLDEIATSARRTAAMRTEIEATRSQTYVTTRLIVVLTIAMVTWLVVGQRHYMAPYDSPAGQLVLLAVGAVFAAGGLRMHQMARLAEPARLLAHQPDQSHLDDWLDVADPQEEVTR